ncbi:MAG: signal peptidase I [Ruminococcaceae bacterium]|nr:signal peptidase I [Oscillospiraceae bacterium]
MNKKDKKISVEDMDKKPEKKGSKAPLIVGIVLCAILIPILIVNCALIISGFTNPDRPPSLFGMTPMIVLTDSMEPLIDKGDIIISKSVDPDDIQVGDVISFVDPGSSTNAILTHRVIAIDDDNEDGIRYATTAGDNNTIRDYERDLGIAKNAEEGAEEKAAAVIDKKETRTDATGREYIVYADHKDPKPVALTEDKVIGAYSYTRVPFLGNVSMFMQSPWGWIICIAVPLLAFLAYEIISRKKSDKSKEKDMDALLAELEALKAAKAAAEGANVSDASADDASNDSSDDTPKEE